MTPYTHKYGNTHKKINNTIKKSMDQIPATSSTIEISIKGKNIINFKSNVKDNSRKIFPYEGIRFFFNSPDNHLTIRSSDTESKIRLFIQWRIKHVNYDELLQSKIIARTISKEISSDFKQILFSKKK